MEPKEFGEYMRGLREIQRLSLRKCGRMAGISDTYMWQIENGARRPSAEILSKLAPVLEVRAEELMKAVGYLAEPDPGEKELERIEWAFKLATTDPDSPFSTQVAPLLPVELESGVKKAIVIAYELVTGKKLL